MTTAILESCKVCDNRGYRPLIYVDPKTKESNESMMFCRCELGQKLRNLIISFRLEDTKSFANNILFNLKNIKENLYSPSEASRLLQILKNDIENVVKKIEKEAFKYIK